MFRLKVNLSTHNEDSNPDLAVLLLRKMANEIESEQEFQVGKEMSVKDRNGNTIGKWSFINKFED
jgi:hypothetical protein